MTTAAPDPRRWAGLGVLSLSLLVVVMDMTILNVALPELARDVQPTAVELLWIVDVYSLVVAGLLVTASAIGDRIGKRTLLVAGYTIFGLASLLILVADGAEAIIAVRALLGLGGAMIMPATLSMIRTLFTDERERNLALGAWAAVAGAGAAIGPVVGGLLLEAFSWQAAFLVNVPLMVIAVVAALVLLPEHRATRPARVDAPGVLLSIAGAAALMYAIKHLGKEGLDVESVGFGVLGTAALMGFVQRCLRAPEPMLDVRLLAIPKVRAGALTALLLMVATGGLMLTTAQWLQLVEGQSALGAALTMLPLAGTAIVTSLLVPGAAERYGARACLAAALVVGGVGLLVPLLLPGPITPTAIAVAFGLAGISFGALAIVSGLIMSGTPVERASSAASIEETSYEFGAALSITIIGSLATAIYRAGLPDGVGGAVREGVAGALAAGDPGLLATAGSAYTDALLWVGIASAAAMLLTALVVWVLLRPQPLEPVAVLAREEEAVAAGGRAAEPARA